MDHPGPEPCVAARKGIDESLQRPVGIGVNNAKVEGGKNTVLPDYAGPGGRRMPAAHISR